MKYSNVSVGQCFIYITLEVFKFLKAKQKIDVTDFKKELMKEINKSFKVTNLIKWFFGLCKKVNGENAKTTFIIFGKRSEIAPLF